MEEDESNDGISVARGKGAAWELKQTFETVGEASDYLKTKKERFMVTKKYILEFYYCVICM